jgi:hypothetical protein
MKGEVAMKINSSLTLLVPEINLGTRTVLEYVLSPVQKAFHEAARER